MSTIPKPPPFLNATAKREWRRVAELLRARELWDELRLSSLEAYAIAYGRFVDTERKIAKADDAKQADRLMSISNTAQRKMREHGRDLGIPIQVQPRPKGKDPEPDPEIDRDAAFAAELDRALGVGH